MQGPSEASITQCPMAPTESLKDNAFGPSKRIIFPRNMMDTIYEA